MLSSWMTLCIYLFILVLRVIRMRLPAVLRQKYSLGGEKCQKKIKTKYAYLVRGNMAPIAHEALAGAGRYRGERYHTHLLQLESPRMMIIDTPMHETNLRLVHF